MDRPNSAQSEHSGSLLPTRPTSQVSALETGQYSRSPSRGSSCGQPTRPCSVQSFHSVSPTQSAHSSVKLSDHTAVINDHALPGLQMPLQRYLLRTILLIIVPPVIAVYFAIICWVYQVPDPETNPYGRRNAQGVFYSWFIIGVFGLGISNYGLTGVEAAMLQDRHWRTQNTMTLLMHSGQSWSGPGGWAKYLKILIRKKKSPAGSLWWLLSFISLLITVALPITGLSIELYDGYVEAAHHPLVIGYFPSNFNNKNDGQSVDRSSDHWRSASSVRLPGAGIAYTPQGLDRSKYGYLAETPNSLSTEQDVPDLFLIPQAKYPVSGIGWGLRLSYNCTMVESASQMTILPNKHSLNLTAIALGMAELRGGPSDTESIVMYNTTLDNLFSYVELGTTSNTNYSDSAEPRIDILEYAMWQARTYQPIRNMEYVFNNSMLPSVSGLGSPIIQYPNGTFAPNASFFEFRSDSAETAAPDALQQFVVSGRTEYDLWFAELAPSMAVRCQVQSETGTARINPDEMSFSGYVRVPPDPPAISRYKDQDFAQPTEPFGRALWEHLSDPTNALTSLLRSAKTPIPLVKNTTEVYSGYFQPGDLQSSLMRAYANDALQIMYDGLDTFDTAQSDLNLTASTPSKILGPGGVPPHIPAVLLCIWALACVLLGLVYGFRRRWAETLDAYDFLRFGADHMRSGDFFDAPGEFYENDNLFELGGLGLLGEKGQKVST